MTPGYRALRESAAWLDLSGRGKIVVRGLDRSRLLHAMTTNHIEQLQPGSGCYAFFLDAHGHILGDVNVLAGAEDHLLDTEPEIAAKLYNHLDRYIIADDVTLEDRTPAMTTLAVEGPGAVELLSRIGAPVPAEAHGHLTWGQRAVARISSTGADGFFLFVPVGEAEVVSRELGSAGAIAASPEDALVVRLESGKPRYGDDITEEYLPHETQQLGAVHFSKGCYIGQEIVERIRSRGHVNRLLVRLLIDSETPPAPGTKLPEGEIRSAAFSPAHGRVIAFAYLRAEHARPGTKLQVAGAEAEAI
jgi:folate-binding protein YgfZ